MLGLFCNSSALQCIFQSMLGTLYLVATPIGNLQDISQRAIETLRLVDLVACEDTRHTGKLLKYLGIRQKLISYHEHNERERADELIEFLKNGNSIAVVSDAGTPGIADPSYRIVEKATKWGSSSSDSRRGRFCKRSDNLRLSDRFAIFRRISSVKKRRTPKTT